MHAHKHTWNHVITTALQRLREKPDLMPRKPHFSSRSGSAASVERDLFDKKRRVSAETNTTDSSSSHHNDSAPPRLQLFICTGEEILAVAIEIFRKRIAAGTATFLVKVKVHRGEPANEGADIFADRAISDPKVGKEWCQRTN